MVGKLGIAFRRVLVLLMGIACALVPAFGLHAQNLLEVVSGPPVQWRMAGVDYQTLGDLDRVFDTGEEACQAGIQAINDYKTSVGDTDLGQYISTDPVEIGTAWNTRGYYVRSCREYRFQNAALAVCPDGYGVSPISGGIDLRCVRDAEPPECETCKAGSSAISQPPVPNVAEPNEQQGDQNRSDERVQVDSGTRVETQQDYSTADGLFTIERYYRSRAAQAPLIAFSEEVPTPAQVAGFGEGWRGLTPGKLIASGVSSNSLSFVSLEGTITKFSVEQAGENWAFSTVDSTRLKASLVTPPTADPDTFFRGPAVAHDAPADLRLSLANGEYILFRRSGTYNFGTQSRTLVPVERGTAAGYKVFYDYADASEYPTKIRDVFGREFALTWTDITGFGALSGRPSPGKTLTQVGLPDGTRLVYGYGNIAVSGSGWQSRLESVQRVGANDQVLWGRTYSYEDQTDSLALTGVSDQNGARLSTTTYNAAGRVTSFERANGVGRWTVRYFTDSTNPSLDIRKAVNPLGREETYTFALPGSEGRSPRKLLRIEGPLENSPDGLLPSDTKSFTYAASAAGPAGVPLLASATDRMANRTQSGLDNAQLRPNSITNALGERRDITWTDGFDLPATISHPNGLVESFEYSPSGQLLSTAQGAEGAPAAEQRTTRYSWDTNGRLLSVNGPRDPADYNGQDDITAFTYDASGNRLTMTNALGHVTTFGNYDANGNPGEMTDPNGVRTVFAYDPLGRVVSSTVKHPTDATQDAVTSYEYDQEGRIIGLTRPDTAKLIFDYDLAGRTTTVRSEDGERIDYIYDAASNVLSETVKRANGTQSRSIQRAYDALSRILTETLGPGRTTRWQYDKNGNQIRAITPRANTTSNAFDALDRLISSRAPDAGTVRTNYDSQDNVTSFKDGIGVTTRFVYNVFGEVTREISPDRGTTIYRYDNAGDLKSVTDGRGATVRYRNDVLGRVVRKTPDDAAQSIFYSWDEPDTETTYRIGRLTKIRDASGTMIFNYDHRGNLTSQRQILANGATTFWLRYAYDLGDRVTRMTYPSGRQVSYRRDTKGRVLSVLTRADTASAWTTLATNMRYEPFGPLAAVSYGNGLASTFDWGNDGRLASRRLYRTGNQANLSSLTYDYDADENITRIVDQVDGTRTQAYDYDPAGRLNRLDTAAGAVQRVDYTYDANGNRLTQANRALASDTLPVSSDSYSYTAGTNRLAAIASPSGTRSITYDGRGNTASEVRPDGINITTTYDGFARLTGYQRTDTALTFAYNGRDDRVGMVRDGVQRWFVYDPDGRVIGEYGAGGAGEVKAEFIWTRPEVGEAGVFGGDDGLGGYHPLAIAAPGAQSGVIELEWVYGSHLGVPLVRSDANGAPVTAAPEYLAAGFPGQTRVLADLYYNRHREFDPTTGRYMQADPIGLAGGANPYAYAEGNPINSVDPLGLNPAAFRAAGAVAGEGLILWCRANIALCMRTIGPAAIRIAKACNAVGKAISGSDGDDPCKGLRNILNEHIKKLADYRRDPFASDNKGILQMAWASGDKKRYDSIVRGRIANLEAQIRNFQKLLQECEARHGK